jgi:serine/threonine protein kinase/Tfp pilus assembly protein PilF
MMGQTISHYKILEKLGEGGMGVVYKAQDTKLDRLVALKFLPPRLSASEEDRMRFLQEAKAASALNHPNVATVYEIGEAESLEFIAMEYVEGETLRSRIGNLRSKGENVSIQQTVDWGLQIAEALFAAHETGIIHRDVKSDNIMVAKDGRVKIMDFGLAKLKGGLALTRTGSTLGTLGYMSPEQILGEDVDQRSDLWSYGVVLYEMLTGELPFEGEHEAAVMYRILNEEPKAILSIRVDVPENMLVLLSQLLQKDRDQRVASAMEVVNQLRQTSKQPASSPAQKSIAVLYFENMSSEKETDYFCAGITEDIITDLSRIKGLKVVSRTDVLPLRNREVNTSQVGKTLKVNYILDGSIRKAGNKIRITAQLIDVRTGFHVWADRFDRLVEDIFDIQNEVSQKIAEALKISLTEPEKRSLGKKPTDDLRAYDFYMRGRELLSHRGRKNNDLAIQLFEKALSFDSNFASAYAGLGEAYSYLYEWYQGDSNWLEKSIAMNERALSIDPDSIEAQFGIAMVYLHQKRFGEARSILKRIVEKKPDSYDAYRRLGMLSDIEGDLDAATKYYERCAAIKPYSEEPWMHLDATYRRKGDSKASDHAARKLIEVASRKLELNPDDVVASSRLAAVYARFGGEQEAGRILRRVLEIDSNDGLVLYHCACAYAMKGDKLVALACLRNAIESGWKGMPGWAKVDPDLQSLQDDQEFRTLFAEFG